MLLLIYELPLFALFLVDVHVVVVVVEDVVSDASTSVHF